MKSSIIGAAALAGCRHFPRRKERLTARKPNVLFVFADQMRYSALGCMGNDYIQTPNFDQLARQGLLLTNAFSCSPVCSPYRAQLMTGRYSHVTGVVKNDIKLPESEVSIAEVLGLHGYATGYVGKWHLEGGREAPEGDVRKTGFVPPGPSRQGFEYWAALECAHEYFDTVYFRDSPEPIPVNTYEPTVQTDLAIDFMRRRKDHPFLLMLSWGPPHNPYTPPEKYDIYDPAEIPLRPNVPKAKEQTAREDIAGYYGLVTSLDDEMGRLTAALDELGIADHTILCFTSDHGDMLYSQGRIRKQAPWEESIHVPFIMRYPQSIPANQQKDFLFASVDIMPTLLRLCGAPVPAGVQGKDLSPLILGASVSEPESIFLSITGVGNNTPFQAPWRGVRTKEWLYAWSVAKEDRDWVLYNVKEDPYELHNLIDDPGSRTVREKLRARVQRWRKETDDTIDLMAVQRAYQQRCCKQSAESAT